MNQFIIILSTICVFAAGKLINDTMHEQTLKLIGELDNKWITSNIILGVVVPLENKTVNSGEHITLHCEIGGTPTPILFWTHNGMMIQGDMIVNIEEKILNRGKEPTETGVMASTYTIPCAQFIHSGSYRCIGYNGYTTIESSAEVYVGGTSKKCNVKNDSVPQITDWTESRAENQGNSVALVCRADSPSNWTWTFDNEMIITQQGRYEIREKGDLVIHNIDLPDLGAYYCTASNEFGNSTAETYLHVTSSHS